MIQYESEARILKKAKDLLDESVENLSPDVRLRLRQARIQALEAAGRRRFSFFALPRWITVGGLATAATAVLAFFFWFNPPSPDFPAKQVEDFEILTAGEQIDLLNDLEFFRWLAMKENGT